MILPAAAVAVMCFAVAAAPDDPRLARVVDLPPAYQSLSRHLANLESRMDRVLVKGQQVPDGTLFLSSAGLTASEALKTLREFHDWTQGKCRHEWLVQPYDGDGEPVYLFNRRSSKPGRSAEQSGAREYLMKHLNDLRRGRTTDPELRSSLESNPTAAGQWALLASVPPRALGGALTDAYRTGQGVIPLAGLDAALIRRATGGTKVMGRSGQLTFDSDRVVRGEGHLVLEPRDGRGGRLPALMMIITGQNPIRKEGATGPSHDLLNHATRHAAELRVMNLRNPDRRRIVPPPASIPRLQSVVSLKAGMPLTKGELPLSGYLRDLAAQSGLTVLASWPEKHAPARARLNEDIDRQPVARVIDILAGYYQLESHRMERAVWFRQHQKQKGSGNAGAESTR